VPTIVAHFDVPFVRCLDPEGRVVDDLPPLASDSETLRSLFRAMIRVRLFDAKAIALQRTGQLGTYASCLGHEALHVGIGSALRPEDVFFPTYREYGAQLWRGVRMSEILLFWGGDERGSAFAEQPHDFPWAVPIGTQTLHASGAALAFRLRREPRVALATVGDGGTSQGDFYEAMNAAGVWTLPVVFVVANNRWAISVPLGKQTAAPTLAQKAIAAGIPGVQVDGNDLLAVRAVLDEAIARARRGDGPTVVEALTYRLSDHTTADDARRYRTKEEVDRAWAEEPLVRLRRFLVERSLWTDAEEKRWSERCQEEIEEAVRAYLAVGKPPIASMFDHTFAALPASLAAQRAEALAAVEAATHG
jgi:pyruvate dehydrogenase E1 component alpha subunit